ncbi:MAG: hypothetical protein IPP93_11295 [Chitinophagaceae bacterium]|nr:hypothetical protein [Chitinophagaceae bacterium]
MNAYRIALKNAKINQYKQLTFFVFMINWAIFIYLGIVSPGKSMRISMISAAVLITIFVIDEIFLQKNNKKNNSIKSYLIFLTIAAAWLIASFWWMSVIIAFIFLMYTFATRELVVDVNKEFVRYPSFPVKTLGWNKISQVILKDGLLTIDLQSNKLYQSLIADENPGFRESEFNEFCQKQLSSSNP